MQPIPMESSQSVDRFLSLASAASGETRARLSYGPTNRLEIGRIHPIYTPQRVRHAKQLTEKYAPEKTRERFGYRISVNAALAEHFEAGNCGEHASVAFKILERMGARPIEYVGVVRPNNSHAFVVISRKKDSILSNPATWGSSAVVCDPWGNKVYRSSEATKQMGADLPFLHMFYCLDK